MKAAFSRLTAHVERFIRGMHPTKVALIGYASYILIGWVLLCVPWTHRERGVGALDNLFVATSAVSTTGLTPVSVADDYSFLGQIVILALIQFGGIGYMTLGSFVVLSRKSELSEMRTRVGKTVFSLPASISVDQFIVGVMVFTALIEFVGAVALYFVFQRAALPDPLWSAIFHSVSAFCTAGFGLYNDSFMAMADNFWLNAVVAALSYLGAIGFIVFLDVWRMLRGRVEQITLTSKVILWTTFWMSVVGTLLLFLAEPSIRDKPVDARLMAAFFQAMTAMTTVGFNTVDIGTMSHASLLILITLMVIGASPSGTGGGLKSTTFSAFLGVIRSALRGEHEVRFWGRPVPLERVWTAVASAGFYVGTLIFGTYLLELTESSRFDQNLFEAASAIGTVGLSTGITASLSTLGKIIIVFLMFCGRLGPLTFGIALFSGSPAPRTADNDLAV